jgi:putative two-component system response regulator
MPGELTTGPTPQTILIVDDEPLVRDVLLRWLMAEGYSCLTAADATLARQALEQQSVDLVTCDINMPGVSGLQLLGQIKATWPDMAVLMLTGCGETTTAIRALTEGACGYLLKPVQREELLFQVQQGLERSLLRRERRRYTEELERRVLEQTQVIRSAHEETIHRLVTASSFRDEETGAHIRRTGLFSEALAKAAGWSRADCERIRMAAPMHDVGKIGIPDAVLRKPGRLTAEEFDVMKRHAEIGARMLAGSSSSILQLACEIAQNHHERWDGTGYPNAISGELIPESARILAIVDVYDALSHDRVYRPAFPNNEVLRMLQEGSGSHFDPVLLALFLSIWDEIHQIAAENPDHELIDTLPAVPASTICEVSSLACTVPLRT